MCVIVPDADDIFCCVVASTTIVSVSPLKYKIGGKGWSYCVAACPELAEVCI